MRCQSVNKDWVFPKIKYSLLTILNLYENPPALKASHIIVFNYTCCQKKVNKKTLKKKKKKQAINPILERIQ